MVETTSASSCGLMFDVRPDLSLRGEPAQTVAKSEDSGSSPTTRSRLVALLALLDPDSHSGLTILFENYPFAHSE